MTTVNYAWTLPTVGASTNTWGTLLNTILTDIDSKMVTATHIVAERSASRALTNLTGLTVVSGGASIAGNVAVTGRVETKAGNAVRFYRPDDATYSDISMAAGASGGLIFNNANGDGFTFKNTGSTIAALDASGSFLVGTATPISSTHVISKATGAEGGVVLSVLGDVSPSYATTFYDVRSTGSNADATAVKLGKNSTTSRSINAAGTINASGADYAEYERNNGTKFAKGQVVGFKEDGTLTDVYADAIRFGVKSTNPGLVGGDAWGTDKQVGKRPNEPKFEAPAYQGPQDPGEAPTEPVQQTPEDDTSDEDKAKVSEDFATAHAAWVTTSAAYEKLAYAHRAAQTNHAAHVEIAKNLFDTAIYPKYQRELTAFKKRLEAERQTVDRIAYCGKVPVAVYGASAGGYIIADKDSNGKIIGKFVADPDFGQYKKAVGRVNRVMAEAASAHLVEAINGTDPAQFVGMAEIAVITH